MGQRLEKFFKSEIHERLLHKQLSIYFHIFSSQLFGFRFRYSTKHALLRIIDCWDKCLDKSGFVETVLIDLLKAFDFLDHDLLLAKLAAYCIDRKILSLIESYSY